MFFVRVYGDEATAKAFRTLGLKVRDLRDAWQRIGGKIHRDAIPLTPVLTGELVNSLRASKAKTQAVVRAGNRRVVYAGVQNYGGYNNIHASHFLNKALLRNRDYAEEAVSSEIEKKIRQAGLS